MADHKFTAKQIDFLSKYNFAESGNQKPETWIANTYAAIERLNSGKYGDTLEDVVNGMSSAIKTNSPQWQLATGQKKMNKYEQNVMKKIYQQMYLISIGQVNNPTPNATHFENIEKYGIPSWAKKMKKVGKVGEHTYYKE